jgi:hypothetical protein
MSSFISNSNQEECLFFNIQSATEWEKIIKSPKIETIGTLIIQGTNWDSPEARACFESLPRNIINFNATMTDAVNLESFTALPTTLETLIMAFAQLPEIIVPLFPQLRMLSVRNLKGAPGSSIKFMGDAHNKAMNLRYLSVTGFENVTLPIFPIKPVITYHHGGGMDAIYYKPPFGNIFYENFNE